MTFAETLAIAILAAIAVQALTLLREEIRRSRENRQSKIKNVAILSYELDMFAYQCADYANDLSLAEETDGNLGRWHGDYPDLDFPRENIDPHFISPLLLAECFALKVELTVMSRKFAFQAEVDEFPVRDFEKSLKDFGLSALSIAQRLRKMAGLPEPNVSRGWNYKEYLGEA